MHNHREKNVEKYNEFKEGFEKDAIKKIKNRLSILSINAKKNLLTNALKIILKKVSDLKVIMQCLNEKICYNKCVKYAKFKRPTILYI